MILGPDEAPYSLSLLAPLLLREGMVEGWWGDGGSWGGGHHRLDLGQFKESDIRMLISYRLPVAANSDNHLVEAVRPETARLVYGSC